jgi:hypothetical protein
LNVAVDKGVSCTPPEALTAAWNATAQRLLTPVESTPYERAEA